MIFCWNNTVIVKGKIVVEIIWRKLESLLLRHKERWHHIRIPSANNELNRLAQQLCKEIKKKKHKSISVYLQTIIAEKDTIMPGEKQTEKSKS